MPKWSIRQCGIHTAGISQWERATLGWRILSVQQDGDPLDVMVIHDAGTFPGLVLTCKIIGVLQVEQHRKGKKAKRNDRVFAVPRGSHAEKDLSDVRDLTSAKRERRLPFLIVLRAALGHFYLLVFQFIGGDEELL